MITHQSSNVKIEYDQAKKHLIQTWTGFATSEAFREAIDKTVSFAKINPVEAIISDTLNQSVVKTEDTQYAASVMPALFQSGLKAMAFVMPRNAITQLSLKQFAEGQKMDNIQYFTSVIDAKKWLDSFLHS